MAKRKITGWGMRGRPFSPKEYENSYIKKSFKESYAKYLKDYAILMKLRKKKRK